MKAFAQYESYLFGAFVVLAVGQSCKESAIDDGSSSVSPGTAGRSSRKCTASRRYLIAQKDNLCFEPSRCHSKLTCHQVPRRSSFVQKNWGSICCVCIKYSNCLRRVNVRYSKTSFVMSIRLNRS